MRYLSHELRFISTVQLIIKTVAQNIINLVTFLFIALITHSNIHNPK